ncbi:Osmotically-inducible protein Y [Andreprevotia sp. IGB-42]|uniref:BON domain-containing protein n=1 Tax=Andreprevotia sp. IGB-42 TaxID=2497473 RepID=UPI00135ADA8D|nr:BON domain-containing protein [Andreprevotia sp. IGB-42]KAF0813565.1 Osmotically-inducible protein Y [Andreprevotia sp. IGB-42]
MQNSKLMGALLATVLTTGVAMSYAADQAEPAKVAANATSGDAAIAASAKAALRADAQLATLPIDVTSQNGVLAVSGEVPSAAEGERVLQILASVDGVREVKNGLKVKAVN